jgi:hypothetical protein
MIGRKQLFSLPGSQHPGGEKSFDEWVFVGDMDVEAGMVLAPRDFTEA